MGALVTRCPVTGIELHTGIETDLISMQLSPDFVGRVHCPHCNAEHTFSKTQAFVREYVDGAVQYTPAA